MALSEPAELDGVGIRFACPPDEQSFVALSTGQLAGDAVQVAGQRLYEPVSEHERIKEKLNEALGAESGERAPIFVKLRTAGHAEALPWETLCSPDGNFLGLDERWSLARIVEPTRRGPKRFEMTLPIRIAAVLSCLGVPAYGELAALCDAMVESRLANYTQLLVFTSEEDVYNKVQQKMASTPGRFESFNVRFVPNDLDELCDSIKSFEPHVLHFFCHGSKSDASIEVATKSSWQTNPVKGLLSIGARQFQGFRQGMAELPWLITLNCCEGAGVDTSTTDTRSVAFDLVYYGIAPAVVGMREAITSRTANVLTRVFYRQLLNDLAGLRNSEARDPEVDWARLVAAAREAVALKSGTLATASRSTKQWTLPVLYVRPSEFAIQPDRHDFLSRVNRRELDVFQNLREVQSPGEENDFTAGIRAASTALLRSLSSDPGPDQD